MEKIGEVINRVVKSMENTAVLDDCGKGKLLQKERLSCDIESLWCRVVDENLRAHSYVEALRKGTLCVRVDSSCYLSALRMKSGDIIAGLKRMGINIRSIKFLM